MKNSSLFLFALGTVALTACSSLDVNSTESLKDNYPEDFVAMEYMALHPGLRSLQIQDYVKQYNANLDTGVDVTADTAAFFSDTSILHQLYVNPNYAGYNEDLWAEDWEPVTTTKDSCTNLKIDTLTVRVEVTEEASTSVKRVILGTKDSATGVVTACGKLSYGADGSVSEVKGLDTAGTEVTYTIDDTHKFVTKRGSIETDTTKTCVEIQVSSNGGIPSDKRKQLLKFNFNDNLDDLAALSTVPVDTFAISSQFLMFGKSHGWAYRTCTDAEKNNPLQSETEYPMTKLYCADGELVREIAE